MVDEGEDLIKKGGRCDDGVDEKTPVRSGPTPRHPATGTPDRSPGRMALRVALWCAVPKGVLRPEGHNAHGVKNRVGIRHEQQVRVEMWLQDDLRENGKVEPMWVSAR